MKWSEKAWDAVADIYAKILASPFIRELTDGSLDREKFVFYIRQDALYLADFGKALAVIASKTERPDHRKTMLEFASESIAVEQALHETFFAEYGVDATINDRRSPTCLLYTSYLLRLTNEPVEVMMAAVLPCFRIYRETGDYIKAGQTRSNNPYRAWIDTYGGEEYARSVAKATDICDSLAAACTEERRAVMTEAFATCSRMEWMFWDSAYNLESWKV